jgi:hypothetical protein
MSSEVITTIDAAALRSFSSTPDADVTVMDSNSSNDSSKKSASSCSAATQEGKDKDKDNAIDLTTVAKEKFAFVALLF